jgi:predicted Fe-Mo cluster-binding NifX family protein
MRVAVTYKNGQVFQHFGHTEIFKVYDIENNKVTVATTVNTNGSGHGALADILKTLNVTALVCGGIGGGAKRALAEAGITLYGGVSGDADSAVEALLQNKLNYDSNAECSHQGEHHGGHHDGSCGAHRCGEHQHGDHPHNCGGHVH